MNKTRTRLQLEIDTAVEGGRMQKDIAAAAGLSNTTISRIRTGAWKPQQLDTIQKIARALGVPWQRLIDEEESTSDANDAGALQPETRDPDASAR